MPQTHNEDLLDTQRTAVKAEWIDYNGHMSEAYYVLVFGFATDELLASIGVDEAYREANQCSVYTLEGHINYLLEVPQGVAIRVYTQLLARDHKRLHVYHHMVREDTGDTVATTELMLMYIDMASGKSSNFPPAIEENVSALATRHARLGTPKYTGRTIGL